MKIWINADDYGWDESCSRAILDAFEKGWLTTTTACANGSFFEQAAELILNSNYKEKVGLHLNLTEGRPVSSEILDYSRVCKDGSFHDFPSRQFPLNRKTREAIYNELKGQAEKYRNTGLNINHIDSHHFIHNSISTFPLCLEISEQFGCSKIRKFRNVGNISFIKSLAKKRYNKILEKKGYLYSDYFGSAEDYMGFENDNIESIFEIMVHPDYSREGVLIDRINADYDNPEGKPLVNLIEEIKKRGDTIL